MCLRSVANRYVCPTAERSRRFVVALGCGLTLLLTGCSQSSGTAATAATGATGAPVAPVATVATAATASTRSGSAYTLMQMNLCLSGLAGCYAKVEYPAVLDEAVARTRTTIDAILRRS